MNPEPTSQPGERGIGAAHGVLVALIVYFLAQIVVYFASTRFYGQGISYLLNFLEIGYKGYVRVYLLESSYYPPFYYLWLLAAHPLAGSAYTPYVIWSALLAAGGALYLFALVRRFAGRWSALLAVSIFLLAPATTIFSKALIIEAPLMLFVPATIYHLAACERFSRRGHCVMLGVMTGLGLLSKWTFSAYVLGGFLVAIADAVFDFDERKFRRVAGRQWLGAGLFAAATLAVAGWWYLFVFDFSTWRATADNDPRFLDYSYTRQVVYCVHLLWINLGKVFGPTILVALAVLLPLTRKTTLRAVTALVALGVVPFLLFAIPVHMEDRYLYPLVFALALTAALVVRGVRWRWLKIAAATLILGTLVYNHAVVYYPLETDLYRDDDPVIHRWGKLFWGTAHTPEILDRIARFADEKKITRQLLIAPHPLWCSYHCNFLYVMYFLKTNPDLVDRLESTRLTKFRYQEFSENLESYDFIVLDERFRLSYMEPDTEEARRYLEAISSRNYIDQNLGIEFPRFDVDDVWKDYGRILIHFRELETYRWENAYEVKIFVNRKLLEPESAPAPESVE